MTSGRPIAFWRRVVLAGVAAFWLSGCGPHSPRAAVAAPAEDSVSRLQRRVKALISDQALERTTWGIAVRSLAREATLCSISAERLLTPASAMKVITLAIAAERLGWNYRYETRVLASGPIAGGTLQGDLVIVGSGDPSLDDWDGAATRLFRGWADQLKAQGITRIAGRIVGDDRAFDGEPLGTGWAWDDLASSFATGTGALQFNQNTAQLVISPAVTVDEPATVMVRPPEATLRFRSAVTTSVDSRMAIVTVRPVPRSGILDIVGSVPRDRPAIVRNVAVENPALYFVASVRAVLLAEGIVVDGPPVAIGGIDDAAGPVDISSRTNPSLLATYQSPTLGTLAQTMMKLSQNLYAETLLKTLGAETAGIGSREAGLTVAREVLREWGSRPEDVQMVDGSGLSRYNLLTPRALVDILAHVHRDERLREPFEAALPVAGVDGTLAQRLRGTRAQGNALAKTGSLMNARSVAGYVRSADGELLAFAVLANNYGVPSEVIDRTADAVIVALAEFRR